MESISYIKLAVSSAKISLDGVIVENKVGTRTILDVLNAEQEMFNAESALVSAERDVYVSGFSLLSNIGLINAKNLEISN
jgi:outer membrane protein